MAKQLWCLATVAVAALAIPAFADEPQTYAGPMSGSETAFVSSIQSDLGARFAHASDAEKAGYVRYTSEDETGAISYADRQWTSDPAHPSQLWYDKNGNLLGADFSTLRPHGEPRPALWGVNPGRWVEFDGHVHWVLKGPDGQLHYDQALWNDKWVAAGGSLTSPSPDTVVKLGETKDPTNVVTIFEFPTIWDLIVWIKPNANGAFANRNPSVVP